MKNLLLIGTAILAVSCNNLKENEYLIAGTIDPSFNGRHVILKENNGSILAIKTVDSTVIENGKFSFRGTTDSIKSGFFYIEGKEEDPMAVYIEKGTIDIKVDKDTVSNSVISGTLNNDAIYKYLQLDKEFNNQYSKIYNTYNDDYMKAVKEKDTVNEKRLKKIFDDFYNKNYSKYSDFMKENPDSEVSLLAFSSYCRYKTDKDFNTLNNLYKILGKEVKETKRGKKVGKEIENMGIMEKARARTAVGTPAPDFKGTTPNGETLSLKEAMGKVTIIDFWASWCGPCVQQTPKLVSIYNEFHHKGLNIIGVSLDNKETEVMWNTMITERNLNWQHITNYTGWDDPIVKEYGIKGIPEIIVLNSDGIIVARDIEYPELRNKIKELLAE